MKSDVELIREHIPEGIEKYVEAKSFMSIAPKTSLSELRGLLHLIINNLGSLVGADINSKKLGENIKLLQRNNLVNPCIIDLLYKIKKMGDMAVHPEEYGNINHEEFIRFSYDSFECFCKLIVLIRRSVLGRFDDDFEFVKDQVSELKALAYSAIFTNSVHAKYIVSCALMEQEIAKVTEAKNLEIIKINSEIFLALMKDAAHNGSSEAALDLAMILLNGIDVIDVKPSNDINKIIMLLKLALDDLPEAKALYALLLMRQIDETDTVMINESIDLLKAAAEDESPTAIYTLYKLYSDGQQVAKDSDLAIAYLEKAVSLGFPQAQHKLGTLLVNSGSHEEALICFEKAISNGFIDSVFSKAELLFKMGRYQLAIDVYKHYILSPFANNHEYKIISNIKIYDCLFKSAGDDLEKLKNILFQFVLHTIMEGYSTNEIKLAENISKPILKKIKGKLSPDKNDQAITLPIYFKKDGSIRDLTEVQEILREIKSTSGISKLNNDIYPLFKKPSQSVVTAVKLGRNESCPCGSGNKFKRCCGA